MYYFKLKYLIKWLSYSLNNNKWLYTDTLYNAYKLIVTYYKQYFKYLNDYSHNKSKHIRDKKITFYKWSF